MTRVIGTVLFVAILVPLIVPVFQPWTSVNCSKTWLNLRTGHTREERYLFGVRLRSSVHQSALSESLGRDPGAFLESWVCVNLADPYRRTSPGSTYADAAASLGLYESVCIDCDLDAGEKEQLAQELTSSWEATGSGFEGVEKLKGLLMNCE